MRLFSQSALQRQRSCTRISCSAATVHSAHVRAQQASKKRVRGNAKHAPPLQPREPPFGIYGALSAPPFPGSAAETDRSRLHKESSTLIIPSVVVAAPFTILGTLSRAFSCILSADSGRRLESGDHGWRHPSDNWTSSRSSCAPVRGETGGRTGLNQRIVPTDTCFVAGPRTGSRWDLVQILGAERRRTSCSAGFRLSSLGSNHAKLTRPTECAAKHGALQSLAPTQALDRTHSTGRLYSPLQTLAYYREIRHTIARASVSVQPA
jgi:hypothetical protein